jgi:hypothetical protein
MEPSSAVPTPRPRSRAWVGFFVILVILAIVAMLLPIFYNLGQQLRPEQLQAARQRWRERGPSDYDLTFAITYDREPLPERHIVVVRGGKVVFASCEGEILSLSGALRTAAGLPAGGLGKTDGRDVPAIFDHIEALLREEGTAARRNFLVAVFDPKNGYPRRFIRRVRGSSTREEWNLRLWPAGTVERGEAR